MLIFLFIAYGIVLCYLLRRMRFFRDSGIRPSVLLLLFALRVAAGCLHNIVAWRFYPNHGDVWAFFQGSFISSHELFHDFPAFIADNSTWAYMPYNVVVMLHVIFNFFSFGNIYINTLFFSFGVFAGSIALFRAFRGFFRNDLLAAACALLIPSTIFWTACVYKEGLIYLSLGFLFYQVFKAQTLGWNTQRVIGCLFFSCLAIFFRAGIVVSLVPALLLWALIGPRLSKSIRFILTTLLAAFILIAIAKPALFSGALSYISGQQAEFQSLKGGSRLPLAPLQPTPGSFLHILPNAIINGFLEPLPGSGGQAIYLVFSIELLLIWSIVLFSCVSGFYLYRTRNLPAPLSRPGSPILSSGSGSAISRYSRGFTFCCLFFAFPGMLLIGYIIPFAGAIVRYRSLYLPFLLAPYLDILYPIPFFRRLNERLGRLLLETEDGSLTTADGST